MKKLLSILASIGLTASAGATVVACKTDPAPEAKGIEISAKESTLKVGDSTEVTIALNDVDVTDFTPEVKFDKDALTVSTINDGKFTITALDKLGKTKISVEYTKADTDPIKSVEIEIEIIEADTPEPGDKEDITGLSMPKQPKDITPEGLAPFVTGTITVNLGVVAVINTDFTITIGEENILVKAVPTSDQIQGEFTIEFMDETAPIEVIDLSDFDGTELPPLNIVTPEILLIGFVVINQIQFPNAIEINAEDINEDEHTFIVKATDPTYYTGQTTAKYQVDELTEEEEAAGREFAEWMNDLTIPISLNAEEEIDEEAIQDELKDAINKFENPLGLTTNILWHELNDATPGSSANTAIEVDISTANGWPITRGFPTITITRERRDQDAKSLEASITLPTISQGFLNGKDLTKDNVIQAVLDFAIDHDKDLTADKLEIIETETHSDFRGIGEFADGQVKISAKAGSGFEGNITVTLYHPDFIKNVEALKAADEAEDLDAKRDAWNEYVSFRWNAVNEDNLEGRIVALLDTSGDILTPEAAFLTWVSKNFIFNLQRQTEAMGIKKDYRDNGYRHYSPQVSAAPSGENAKQGVITYQAEWRMDFPDGREQLKWPMETAWQITYLVIN